MIVIHIKFDDLQNQYIDNIIPLSNANALAEEIGAFQKGLQAVKCKSS